MYESCKPEGTGRRLAIMHESCKPRENLTQRIESRSFVFDNFVFCLERSERKLVVVVEVARRELFRCRLIFN